MIKRDHIVYLEDILEAIAKIEQFIGDATFDEFLTDEKCQFAVIRALEIIGEASKNIPQEIRDQAPNLPWREMSGMRDKLIHHYFGIDVEVVWNTITRDLPSIKPPLVTLLQNLL